MIRVDSLTRTYGDFIAVDQISFAIEQGEIVGLLGHNGAGKTTIMKLLTGYLEPTAGAIEVDGLNVVSDRVEVQKRIGYLPENDPLYPEMTVIDYLDYVASLHDISKSERIKRIREAIERTELASKATSTIGTLSRGYRQRVGVAQAILHNPGLLVLDEPTNGLDPTQVQHMRGLIRSLAKNATVIISTHILHEVQAICDRVIIIRNGSVALDSTMQSLQSDNYLVVTVDAQPGRAQRLFESVKGVRKAEPILETAKLHRYLLELGGDVAADEAAPHIASLVAAEGMKLYALHPQRRDLETIFGEISAQLER